MLSRRWSSEGGAHPGRGGATKIFDHRRGPVRGRKVKHTRVWMTKKTCTHKLSILLINIIYPKTLMRGGIYSEYMT